MYELFLLTALVVVALTLTSASFQGSEPLLKVSGNVSGSSFVRLVEMLHAPVVLGLAVLVSGAFGWLGVTAGALLLVAIQAARAAAIRAGAVLKCRCFGVLSERSEATSQAVSVTYLATSSALIPLSWHLWNVRHGMLPHQAGGVLLLALILAAAINHVLSKASKRATNAKPSTPTLDDDVILGVNAEGAPVTLKDIDHRAVTILVGISADCGECVRDHDDLYRLVRTFQHKVNCVILIEGQSRNATSPIANPPPGVKYVHADAAILQRLGLLGFPFGLAFDGSAKSAISPPVYGGIHIWLLLKRVLAILEPVNVGS